MHVVRDLKSSYITDWIFVTTNYKCTYFFVKLRKVRLRRVAAVGCLCTFSANSCFSAETGSVDDTTVSEQPNAFFHFQVSCGINKNMERHIEKCFDIKSIHWMIIQHKTVILIWFCQSFNECEDMYIKNTHTVIYYCSDLMFSLDDLFNLFLISCLAKSSFFVLVMSTLVQAWALFLLFYFVFCSPLWIIKTALSWIVALL